MVQIGTGKMSLALSLAARRRRFKGWGRSPSQNELQSGRCASIAITFAQLVRPIVLAEASRSTSIQA